MVIFVMDDLMTQCQHCDVASDITLIELLRFFNKPSESLQKWVATPMDQI